MKVLGIKVDQDYAIPSDCAEIAGAFTALVPPQDVLTSAARWNSRNICRRHMEESHASAMATPSVKSNVSEMVLSEEPDCQSGSSRMKADDLARKIGEPSWDVG